VRAFASLGGFRYNGFMEPEVDIPYTDSAESADSLAAVTGKTQTMLAHADWLQQTGERAVLRGRRDQRFASMMAFPALLVTVGMFFGSDVVWDDSTGGALLSNWLLVGFVLSLLVIAYLWALYRRGARRQETGKRLILRAGLQQRRAREP
jgi:hypothetical protein